MEDERTVPALVSVYKAEVWRHLGFCGNVHPGSRDRGASSTSVQPLAASPFARGVASGRVAT